MMPSRKIILTSDTLKRWFIPGLCKFWVGPNLDYKVCLWVDIGEKTYTGVPYTAARRRRVVAKLREMAAWLEEQDAES